MKKNLLLYILLGVLLVMNGFFLFQHFGKSHRKGKKDNQKPFIVKRLEFNEAQEKQYDALFTEHRERMRTLNDSLRTLKDDFFGKASEVNVEALKIDSLATAISAFEKKKDLELFNHFKKVNDICNDSQKEKFKSIIKKSLRRNDKSRKGPPKEGRKRQ